MAELVAQQPDAGKKKPSAWGKPMEVIGKLATKGREMLTTAVSSMALFPIPGMSQQDKQMLVEFAHSQMDYTKMMITLEWDSRFGKTDAAKQTAKKQLANAKVLQYMYDLQIEMMGIKKRDLEHYREDKSFLEYVRNLPEDTDEMDVPEEIRNLKKAYNIASGRDEKIDSVKDGVVGAIAEKKDELIEKFADVYERATGVKIEDPNGKVAKAGKAVAMINMLRNICIKDYKREKIDRLSNDNYAEMVDGFMDKVISAEDMASQISTQQELVDLYMQCKEKGDMTPFAERADAVLREAFEASGLTIAGRYEKKRAKQQAAQAKADPTHAAPEVAEEQGPTVLA